MPVRNWHVLPPSNRERDIAGLVRVLGSVHAGKPLRVKWEIARPDKTPKQNRYLWAVPYCLLKEHTGYKETDLHEWNCGEQWGWTTRKGPKTPKNPDGVYSQPIRTTTTDENGEPDLCSSDEMQQLWERCQRIGATLGIVIPNPDPDYKAKR